MPLNLSATVEELKRRGVNVAPQPAPVASAPAPAPQPADIQPVPQVAPGAMPAPDFSSPRDVARQLKLKEDKGKLLVQDALNELQRRGVNLALRTQPAKEQIVEKQAQGALQNELGEGDPEAFKQTWRVYFPGRPLPRTPEGGIDYKGGADDIDVETDRRKKLEAAKTGAHNIVEQKVTRTNPQTGKDEEYMVRLDKITGQKLGETLLSENQKPLTESQANAKMFSTRMQSNNDLLKSIESRGFSPTALGTTMQKFLPNRFKSEDVQAYNAAKNNWIAAVLRKESGAAISAKEYSDADKQYFPQDGDAPSVVQQKQQLRELAQTQMREAIGPHQPSVGAAAPAAPGASAPAAQPETVDVKSAAEAPPTAKFIRSPSGRVYRNPKYTGQ